MQYAMAEDHVEAVVGEGQVEHAALLQVIEGQVPQGEPGADAFHGLGRKVNARPAGAAPDEAFRVGALAESDLAAVKDDGTIMVPYNSYPVFRELDVFAGRCAMENPPPSDKRHSPGTPSRVVHPAIPHFVDTYTHHWRYLAEALKLRLNMGWGVPQWLARAIAFCVVAVPGSIRMNGKEWLRPLYRALFGVRAVKANERV